MYQLRFSGRWVDSSAKVAGCAATLLMWSIIGSFFGFIFYQGISAVFHYGLENLFFNGEFNLSNNKVSFWAPFGVTVFLAVFTVILVIPIAIRCSIWINFYCPKKFRKSISTVLLILANVPSVILAMYVRRFLSPFIYKALFLNTSLNLVLATLALVCMILPLIIVLFNSALENKKAWIISGEVLGLEKNYAIHKIIIPKIKHTIIIAITFVVGRVLSESIMLSMLLSAENYSAGYGSGFSGFINSQLNSVAPLIGENYFSDGSSEDVQNLMFLFGGLLLVTSLLCNSFFLEWMKRDRKKFESTSKYPWIKKLKSRITWKIYRIICGCCHKWEQGLCSTEQFIYRSNLRFLGIFSRFMRRSLEYLCLFVFFSYSFSFLGTVIIRGLIAIFFQHYSGHTSVNDTLSRAIKNTALIVFLSIMVSIPIALFVSFYLSEYSYDGKFKKYTLSLINAAAATPSIIFGIFGLFVFIQKLALTASGTSGKSILAGIFTMILFILPYLSNLFYTHISNIPYNYRESSYILGISRCRTFWKIIVPLAFNNLIFSVLLTIGKIIGETAPLYLTAGTNSSPGTLFMYQGQTLTTRIYAQLYESNLDKSEKIINETSFWCLLLISIMVVVGKYGSLWFRKDSWELLRFRLRNGI